MNTSFTYKGATIHADREAVEDEVFTYLEEMAEKELFDMENIHIMPDVHVEPNSRTLIGFTMPFSNQLSPEIIGPDAGCGVTGVRLKDISEDQIPDNIISLVEQKVPLGKGQYSAPERSRDDMVHLKNDFPYQRPTDRLRSFDNNVSHNIDIISEFLNSGGYSFEWVENNLVPRTSGLSMDRTISGLGTLGGGNHFIEIGIDDDGNIWVLCHSGSRKVGGAIFGEHVETAKKHHIGRKYIDYFTSLDGAEKYLRFDLLEEDPVDVFDLVKGGKGGPHIYKEQIREDYTDEEIDQMFRRLSPSVDESVQWPVLTGNNLGKYYIDMIFAQVYAEVNRKNMIQAVCDQIGSDIEFDEYIDNPHNLLSFTDGVIRKGAMSAGDGERGVLPFNMNEGAVLITGNGNTSSNSSAPHGAGRVGSKTDARERFEDGNASEPSVLTNSSDAGEYPHAYKSKEDILPYITSFASVDTYITPLYNIKE